MISGLAEKLHVSVPTISRCLHKLEEKGLIQKNSQTNDRRNTYVCLTPKGNEIYNEAFRTLSSFVEQALSRIDEEELDQFLLPLTKFMMPLSSNIIPWVRKMKMFPLSLLIDITLPFSHKYGNSFHFSHSHLWIHNRPDPR